MIFQNIDFHNVAELEKTHGGYRMCRLPRDVMEQVNRGIRDKSAWYSTGVELRFRMLSNSVKVHLRAEKTEEAQVVCLYYGDFQGGWRYSSKIIHETDTAIEISRPDNMDVLWQITKEKSLPFSPEVVRLVLPYGECVFIGVEGEVALPKKEEMPAAAYLAYGSSITHGSLALAAPYSYPFRIARKFGCDYFNMGFAGSAHLEKAMAQYIVSRKDWNFASVEMGINMLGKNFDEKLFEERVAQFTEILAKDSRSVFITDIFTHWPTEHPKTERYREIVRKYAKESFIYTTGTALLGNIASISQDMAHPSLEGMEEIVNNWYAVMNAHAEVSRIVQK